MRPLCIFIFLSGFVIMILRFVKNLRMSDPYVYFCYHKAMKNILAMQDNNGFFSIDVEIKEFLEEKAAQYNNPAFIDSDPIYVPHQFSLKEDIEISGFLTATIAWGGRQTIIKNGLKLISIMGSSPYDFVINHQEHHIEKLDNFVHRTFNAIDAKFFIRSLKNIYLHHGGLESVISAGCSPDSIIPALGDFHETFFAIPHPARSRKHLSNPGKGSSAKKMNMYLRWMVRNDNKGVDFGLWKNITPSVLSIPLDVHSGNVARKLGLLSRKQNDIKAVQELDAVLRSMDSEDPVKYDFALFGLGVFEKF